MRFKSLVRYFFDKFGNKKKFEAQVLFSAYKKLFLDDNGYGEVVLKDLMRFAHMDRAIPGRDLTSFEFGTIEGKRVMIHYIFDMLNITEIDMLDTKRSKQK